MAADFQTCPDEELARQSQAGSLAAFEELVYRYEGRVYGFVANCCGNSADAREVTQDTFVRAFQAMGCFDPRRGFAPWLFTIARRKCIDHRRAASPTADAPMPELPDYNDPAELLARREERQGLWELARRRLPEASFQALWLRYVEQLSVREIAQVLRKTQTHVKVLLFRARVALGRGLKTTAAYGLAAGPVVPERTPGAQATRPRLVPGSSGARGRGVAELAQTVGNSVPQGARKGSV